MPASDQLAYGQSSSGGTGGGIAAAPATASRRRLRAIRRTTGLPARDRRSRSDPAGSRDGGVPRFGAYGADSGPRRRKRWRRQSRERRASPEQPTVHSAHPVQGPSLAPAPGEALAGRYRHRRIRYRKSRSYSGYPVDFSRRTHLDTSKSSPELLMNRRCHRPDLRSVGTR